MFNLFVLTLVEVIIAYSGSMLNMNSYLKLYNYLKNKKKTDFGTKYPCWVFSAEVSLLAGYLVP